MQKYLTFAKFNMQHFGTKLLVSRLFDFQEIVGNLLKIVLHIKNKHGSGITRN